MEKRWKNAPNHDYEGGSDPSRGRSDLTKFKKGKSTKNGQKKKNKQSQ